FRRQNIPVQFHYYKGRNLARGRDEKGTEPCDIPFLFERFNLATIERFVCIESPSKETLVRDRFEPFPEWCFSCGKAKAGLFRLRATRYPKASSHIPDDLWAEVDQALARGRRGLLKAAPSSLKPGSIQELYDQIEELFVFLDGRGNLF